MSSLGTSIHFQIKSLLAARLRELESSPGVPVNLYVGEGSLPTVDAFPAIILQSEAQAKSALLNPGEAPRPGGDFLALQGVREVRATFLIEAHVQFDDDWLDPSQQQADAILGAAEKLDRLLVEIEAKIAEDPTLAGLAHSAVVVSTEDLLFNNARNRAGALLTVEVHFRHRAGRPDSKP